jgi:hypothetical protein
MLDGLDSIPTKAMYFALMLAHSSVCLWLSALGTSATVWPIVTASDDCEVVGGMIGRGNRSTPRKFAPVSPFPLQIPHYMFWARIRASAMGCRRLTAWATPQPKHVQTGLGVRPTSRPSGCGFFPVITPWPVVRDRTIPTERPPLVDEI